MQDQDLARIVMNGFLQDIPRQIEALQRCLDVKDAPGAAIKAHLIKGAAANVGGEQLRSLGFEMEKSSRAGDLESIAFRMDELNHQFLRLKEAMSAMLWPEGGETTSKIAN
jgi:HPt (histidine-containing phosphotransfer) domain-containing protein